jgi:hypothetical protein
MTRYDEGMASKPTLMRAEGMGWVEKVGKNEGGGAAVITLSHTQPETIVVAVATNAHWKKKFSHPSV